MLALVAGIGVLDKSSKRRDRTGTVAGERHFDEDQWLVNELRMEEAVAAPVAGREAAAQIVPVADGVDLLVTDDLFKDVGGRGPVDPLQHEKTSVEPRREQMDEIAVDMLERGMIRDMGQQHFPHLDQRRSAAWCKVEPPDQFLAPRLGSLQ